MISSYPKIFALGTRYVNGILDGEHEITEKIDGSQIAFGIIEGNLYIRSKGKDMDIDAPEKMFAEGVDYIKSICNRLPSNLVFYGEYLRKPKHNTIAYSRIPKNHIMLFGVMDMSQSFRMGLDDYADRLEVEAVPVLKGDNLAAILETESVLGGSRIEGIVVKNYGKTVMVGGQVLPLMAAKLVSEKFKEVHRERWGKEEKFKGKWETFCDSFCTEARWRKAVQHLRESGTLKGEPSDIGAIMSEVNMDIEAEERQSISNFLYAERKREVMKAATKGLPEWYKKELAFSE